MFRAILLLLPVSLAGQPLKQLPQRNHEIRMVTENDNYMMSFHDGYYTNGLFLEWSHPSQLRVSRSQQKLITYHRLGQMIFVSEHFRDRNERVDRPMSGYLFMEKGYRHFSSKGHIAEFSLHLGSSGKYSFARQVQGWYHRSMGLPVVRGWDRELPGSIDLDLQAAYTYNILGVKRTARNLEWMLQGSARLGTAFSYTEAGTVLKFGNFELPWQSSYYSSGTGIRKEVKRNAEIFVYTKPVVRYQIYNVTVQGPLFKKAEAALATGIIPWVYLQEWGIYYAEGRVSLFAAAIRKTREASSMRQKRENYGRIGFAYRFK